MAGAEPARTLRGLWLCLDLAVRPASELRARARAVLDTLAGDAVGALWVRAPQGTQARTLVSLARELCALCEGRPTAVLVGDRVDVALASGAHGVHLGSRSLAPHEARRVADRSGKSLLISSAVHDRAELDARASSSDALVASPVFEVPGKGAPLGLGGLAVLHGAAPAKLIVALGGLDAPERVAAVRRAGARAAAVRRAVLAPESVTEAVVACERLASALGASRPA